MLLMTFLTLARILLNDGNDPNEDNDGSDGSDVGNEGKETLSCNALCELSFCLANRVLHASSFALNARPSPDEAPV